MLLEVKEEVDLDVEEVVVVVEEAGKTLISFQTK